MKVVLNYPIIRFVLLFCIISTTTDTIFAQKNKNGSSECQYMLDEAKDSYQEGELEDVERITDCANNSKSMSREKRIEALQLLTESYLYRDKIGAADKSFRTLLKANPLYVADSTDPNNSYDLIYLSRTFSRRPILSMYFGIGTNFSLIEQLENYGVDNTSGIANHEGYLREIVMGFNGSIGFELPLIYNFSLALDATFGYRTYAFGDSLYMSVNPSNPTGSPISQLPSTKVGVPLLYSVLKFQENQYWIDIPLMLRYNITFKGLLPYVYAGVAGNFLLSADMSGIERTTEPETTGGGDVTQAAIEPILLTSHVNERTNETMGSLRTMLNFSFVAGAGVKVRVGRNFFFVDFRYTRMFFNNVDLNNRYENPDLLYNYGHVDNDFRTDNFALTVGFIKAFYKPRKKHNHNPIVLSNKYNKWLEKERDSMKKETDEDLKRELNSAIKDMEKQKPSLIEDVQKGKSKGSDMMSNKQKELDDIKNKRVKVEVKYE
jgi:hypothetical protein